jgi:exonuclease III
VKKLIFILIGSFFLSANSSQGQNLDDIVFGTDSTFDVVTWNLEWFPKSSHTIDCVKTIIEAMDVEVIAFQEIADTTKFLELADSLPDYDGIYYRVMGDYGGLAYLYRNDALIYINHYSIYTSSVFWNAFPRAPFVLEVEYYGQNIVLINNHFKCCGDGSLDMGNSSDQEYRRYMASSHLKNFMDQSLANRRAIMLGDLNDLLTDPVAHNVFLNFINDTTRYEFIDMGIASGPSSGWSYPGWPSHLDHIMLSNQLLNDWDEAGALVSTIKVDDYLPNGWSEYDSRISDHRPVAARIPVPALIGLEEPQKAGPSIYPNPATDKIYLSEGDPGRDYLITLFGLQGQILSSVVIETGDADRGIDISSLSPGLYIATITTIEGVLVTRTFVKR